MEIEGNSLLNWAYSSHGKGIEELRHSILCTLVEMESTKAVAQQEIRKQDDELLRLRGLIQRTVRERDEVQDMYQKVLKENILLRQQIALAPPISGVSSIEDVEPRRGGEKESSNTLNGGTTGFSSSDCEDTIVSSSIIDSLNSSEMQLPEKGKLLQAVMKAGPLLQTLLLAGPLPQWHQPPPTLESSEIPLVNIPSPPAPPPTALLIQDSLTINNNSSSCNNVVTSCGRVCNKRGFPDELFEVPAETKYQRVALP